MTNPDTDRQVLLIWHCEAEDDFIIGSYNPDTGTWRDAKGCAVSPPDDWLDLVLVRVLIES
jgi:hypothetical protein